MPDAELTPGQVLWRLDKLSETFERRLNGIEATLERRLSSIETTIDHLETSYVRKETFQIELDRRREEIKGLFALRDQEIATVKHENAARLDRIARGLWYLASLVGAVTTAVVAQIIVAAVIR